jgi:hypothetical protein
MVARTPLPRIGGLIGVGADHRPLVGSTVIVELAPTR